MGRTGLMLGAALLFGLVGLGLPVAARVRRSWHLRVAVSGHSMEPALRAGDWLLVEPFQALPHVGDLVVARDPRSSGRLLVKRVIAVGSDASLSVSGDHPAHREESGSIGGIGPELVIGRPWLRYWPVARLARL